MPEISIILPTYNESGHIIDLIEAISKVLAKEKKTFEIIIVDDNSPDGTADIVQKHSQKNPQVKVFVRTKDRGLGKSIGYGVEKAQGEIIIGMDADFNHNPETISKLIKALANCDLAIASRFIKGGGMAEVQRYWPTFFFNQLLRFLGFPSTDNASGYYAIYKKDLEKIQPNRIYYGYGDYHLRLLHFAKLKNLKIAEVPTFYGLRQSGASKSRLFNMAYSYLKEALYLRQITK